MGTPLPPNIIEPGNLCTVCWGESGPFEPPTPTAVTIQLFDWIEGDAWDEKFRNELSAPQIIEQHLVLVCAFARAGTDLNWFLEYTVGSTFLKIDDPVPGILRAFQSDGEPPCVQRVDNALPDIANSIVLGGYAEITFGSP